MGGRYLTAHLLQGSRARGRDLLYGSVADVGGVQHGVCRRSQLLLRLSLLLQQLLLLLLQHLLADLQGLHGMHGQSKS